MSTKVFFNESCSVCKKEIDLYKKMENNLEWFDINQEDAKLTNLTTDQLSRRLHVMKDGKLFQGASAFLILWSKIPKLNFLYRIFKLPIIFQIFSFFYEIVAYFLYIKNKIS
jgi:predicted DCC family thiol-disulfide oxidoreductase YuxK